MRKIMVFILCTALLMSMAACSSENVKGANSNNTNETSAAIDDESGVSSVETVQQAADGEELSPPTETLEPTADGGDAKPQPAADSSNAKATPTVDGRNAKPSPAKPTADSSNAKPSPATSQTESTPTVKKPPESTGKTISFDSEGVEIPMDGVWSTYYNNLMKSDSTFHIGDSDVYGVISISFVSDEGLNKSNDSRASLSANTRNLFTIYIYNKGKLPDIAAVKEKANSKYAEKVKEANDLVYYFCWNDSSSDGLSDVSKEKYEQLYNDIPNLRDKIKFYTPAS